MATKAELETELAKLRKQIADRDAKEAAAAAEETAPAQAGLADCLRQHGLEQEDIEALLDQLAKELGKLPQNKPLLTLIGAFGLGVLLGRMARR